MATKLEELATYLEISPDEIQEDGAEYLTPFGVFTVMTESEADDACYEDIESLIDDLGIEAFSPEFQDTIYSEFLDDDWFSDACFESYESYAYDIENESDDDYANRLIAECVEAGIISDSDLDAEGEYTGDLDLVNALATHLWEDIGNSYISYAKWYQDDFGSDGMKWAINNGASLDLQGIVDECIAVDGYGHFLAGWDGRTIKLPSYYAFKQDDKDRRTI